MGFGLWVSVFGIMPLGFGLWTLIFVVYLFQRQKAIPQNPRMLPKDQIPKIKARKPKPKYQIDMDFGLWASVFSLRASVFGLWASVFGFGLRSLGFVLRSLVSRLGTPHRLFLLIHWRTMVKGSAGIGVKTS